AGGHAFPFAADDAGRAGGGCDYRGNQEPRFPAVLEPGQSRVFAGGGKRLGTIGLLERPADNAPAWLGPAGFRVSAGSPYLAGPQARRFRRQPRLGLYLEVRRAAAGGKSFAKTAR